MKDLTRTELPVDRADEWERDDSGTATRSQVSPADTLDRLLPVKTDPPSGPEDEPARKGSNSPSEDEPPHDALEGARELAIRLLPFAQRLRDPSSWQKAMALLRPRKNEVVPVLENWIRRREELERSGIDMSNIFVAYAKLAGPRAIPTLEKVLDMRTWPSSHHAALALCSVDSPRAVEAVLDSLFPTPKPEPRGNRLGNSLRGPHLPDMWWGAPAFRNLIRRWTTAPPADHSWLMKPARNIVFRHGTAEDRQAVWALLDKRERLRVLRLSQVEKWAGHERPEQLLAEVTQGLSDSDPWVRYLASKYVLDLAQHVDPTLVEKAERVMARDTESFPRHHNGDNWAPSHSMFRSLRHKLLELIRARETAQKQRELLTRR